MLTVVGSLNLDLVIRAPRFPAPGETLLGGVFQSFPGGKGANQAVAAARAGVPVSFVGAVGADHAGQRLRQVLVDEGIDVTFLAEVTEPTGVGFITVCESGENSIIVASGANSTLTYAQVQSALTSLRPKFILTQLETTDEAIRAIAEYRPAVKVLNPAPAQTLDLGTYNAFDWVIPNELEAAALPAGVEAQVVQTLGSRGCEWDGSRYPAPHVEVTDTTAAGDTFCGYFAARLAQGHSPQVAIEEAVKAASLSVQSVGAIPSIPRLPSPSKL